MRLPSVLAVVVLAPACHSSASNHDARTGDATKTDGGSNIMDTCSPCVAFTGSMGTQEEPCGCLALYSLPAACEAAGSGCVCAAECFPVGSAASCNNACAGSNLSCPPGCMAEPIA
jgi:hypothetical protein